MLYAMLAACATLILVLAVPHAAGARRLARLFRRSGVGRDDGPGSSGDTIPNSKKLSMVSLRQVSFGTEEET